MEYLLIAIPPLLAGCFIVMYISLKIVVEKLIYRIYYELFIDDINKDRFYKELKEYRIKKLDDENA